MLDAGVSSRASLPLDAALAAGAGLFVAARPLVGALFAVALAATWLARPRGRSWPRRAALALLAAAVGARAHVGLVAADARAQATRELGLRPGSCTLDAEVDGQPGARRGRTVAVVRVRAGRCGDADVRGALARVGFEGDFPAARGDRLRLEARLAPPERYRNEADPPAIAPRAGRGVALVGSADDAVVVERGRGLLAAVDRLRAAARRAIARDYPSDVEPLARAIVLGESDLDDDDDLAFRRSGLSHLLAVSGMHLVLVVLGAVRAARFTLAAVPLVARGRDVGRHAAWFGVALAWGYALFAGATGSAVRAAAATSWTLGARGLGREPDRPRAFLLSSVAFALADPLETLDPSYALSLLATGALLGGASALEDVLPTVLPRAVARSLAATTAATLATAPLLASFGQPVPAVGLVANLVAVPVGEAVALPASLAALALAPFGAPGRGAALVASGALAALAWIAAFASRAADVACTLPPPDARHVLGAALGFVVAAGGARAGIALRVALVGVALAEAGARLTGEGVLAGGELRVTALDVGQGDALLVELPDGRAMLVDGGGLPGSSVDVGARVLAPELARRRIRRLAAVVLSHPHPDHYGGLVHGLDGVTVEALWDTGQGEAEGAGDGYAELLARLRARGTRVRRPAELCGVEAIGGARVEVLAPCPSADGDLGPNDNSFVLRLAFGSRAFLLVGDAEHEAEQRLLAQRADALHADVLKVGHHGSRTSTGPAFVAAVRPSLALVSTGAQNRFGHPHRETLATLTAAGVPLYRTDLDGAVTVTTDGRRLRVGWAVPSRRGPRRVDEPAREPRAGVGGVGQEQ